MDVLRKKIEDMVNDHAALEKEKEVFQSKLTKVKNDHDALVKSLKSKVKKLEDEKRKIEISAKNTKKFWEEDGKIQIMYERSLYDSFKWKRLHLSQPLTLLLS